MNAILFCIIITPIIVLAIYVAKQMFDAWVEGRAPSPNDKLFNLNFRIDNLEITETNKFYLNELINFLKKDPTIDRIKLELLEKKFKRKYQSLSDMKPQ